MRNPSSLPRRLVAAAALAALPGLARPAITFDIVTLGTLGATYSSATALNNLGQVVGRTYFGLSQAFLYDGTSTRALPGAQATATAINDSGDIAGYHEGSGELRAAVWRGGSFVDLGMFGSDQAYAFGISASGQVALTVGSDSAMRAHRLETDGTLRPVYTPPGASSQVAAMNARGDIVGSLYDAAGQHPFLYRDGVTTNPLQGLASGPQVGATAINNHGHVAGHLDGARTYVSDGTRMVTLATPPDSLATVRGLNDAGVAVGYYSIATQGDTAFLARPDGAVVDLNTLLSAPHGRRLRLAAAINAHGQIAGNDEDQAVLLTPRGTLRWSANAGGSWSDAARWDSGIGYTPSRFLDAVIAPAGSQTVTLGIDTAAKSLVVGGGGGQATLKLESGALLTAAGGVTVQAGGTLSGDGSIAAAVTNAGSVRAAAGLNLAISGGLVNHGLVGGSGRLTATLANQAAGQVRVGAGETLVLDGSGHSNAGIVEVKGGGELEVTGAFGNAAGGTIRLDAATLRFGGSGLDNQAQAQVQIGFGGASISGAVTNGESAKVVASGGSQTTFWDAVVNRGEVRASAGSRVVYFGPVSGSGSFTTQGEGAYHRFEGGYAPGNSPAAVALGDVEFASLLTLELGGLEAGAEHDQMVFGGSVRFDAGAALEVELLDGFAPRRGDAFHVFAYTQAPEGRFGSVVLPGLSGLAWDTSDLYEGGWLRVSAVPEPGTVALWLAGGALLAWRARRVAGAARRL